MIIENLISGNFVERPNRFTIIFETEGNEEGKLAHLRDPGRLKELLLPGVTLLLRKAPENPTRKTKYDVIAVLNNDHWILINSGFHSDIAAELIDSELIDTISDYKIVRREFTYGNSRIDFLLTNDKKDKMLLEVKGCTLVVERLAKFPDAPTSRGKKHIEELISALNDNYNSSILFLILNEDAVEFTPNIKMDPDFSSALNQANKQGVHILTYSFKTIYKKNSLHILPFKFIKVNI